MVSSFDSSSGAEMPGAACFQMNDAEFNIVLRGWKHPPPLGEAIGDRPVLNPFTKQRILAGRRDPVRAAEPPDANAVRKPKVWHLPWIDMGDVGVVNLDRLAEILFGWSPEYAFGEVSDACVNGPEDAHDWFALLPTRVVDAIAAVPDHRIRAIAESWRTSAEGPIEDAEAILLRLVSFARSAVASGRRIYFWGSV